VVVSGRFVRSGVLFGFGQVYVGQLGRGATKTAGRVRCPPLSGMGLANESVGFETLSRSGSNFREVAATDLNGGSFGFCFSFPFFWQKNYLVCLLVL
jgi:hypothetical protein